VTQKRLGESDVDTAHKGTNVDQHFKDLLEASSLGTSASRRIRSSTPEAVVDEVRRRRTERNPLQIPPIKAAPWTRTATGTSLPVSRLPVRRSILAVDIEGSTQRPNPAKQELRQQVYRIMLDALAAAGIDNRYYDPFTDRGDGILVLIHPANDFPKALLLSRVIPALASMVAAHNSGIPRYEHPRMLRLPAVIHAGEVHYDGHGFFGEDLDVAFRLLDAPKFKTHLRNTRADLALVASDEIYQSIIRHGYDGIDEEEFLPSVTVNVGGRRRKGWMHLPRPGEFPAALPARPAIQPSVPGVFEHRLGQGYVAVTSASA
jgi:class 3 adenylate cyclase